MPGCNDCASSIVGDGETINTNFKRVLWIALIANFAMFAVEVVAGWHSGSMALQADALDFFGDAVNYGISLFVLGMSLQRRSYAALFKGLTMAAFGIWVIFNAIERAVSGAIPEPMTMGMIAILALVVNVGVALLLFAYRSGDSNMRSIWLCSRNDAIGNVGVIAAATGVFALDSRWPDLIVATLIAGLSLSAALQVTRLALVELRTNKIGQPETTS